MGYSYDVPKRDCHLCTGYTFPNGCANLCDNFEEEIDLTDEHDPFFEEEMTLSDDRTSICDNCLTASGHCPGQLDCDRWHIWVGIGKSIDTKDMEPRTIGFHLLSENE